MLAVVVVSVAAFLVPVGLPQGAAAAPPPTPGSVAPHVTPSDAPSGAYTAVTPYRVCDTRPAGGAIPANQCNDNSTGAGSGPLTQGATRVITVDNFGTLPASGVTAVVVNLTAVNPSLSTYLTLYQDGISSRPNTSNLNPGAATVLANLVEVGVSASGKIDLFNAAGTTNVIVDIEGYVASGSTGLFTPTTPVRICDTRAAGGGIGANRCNTHGLSPIGANQTLTFALNGMGSPVPASGVSAVVFNLTAIAPTASTVLTAFAGGATRPNASNLNVAMNGVLPNRVIVPVTCVSNNCTVSIWNSAGSVNIAVDVDGWFTTAAGAQFTALATPARVCDTRYGDPSCRKGIVAGGTVVNVNVAGVDGIPVDNGDAGSPVAIVANITAVNATKPTYVSVYPGPTSLNHPVVSDVNPGPGQTATNLVVVGVGSDGTINLFNNVGSTNLIVDVVGYYATESVVPPGATYSSTIGGPGHATMYASGMEIAPNGNIVIADTGNNQVAEYTTAGAPVWRVGSEGSGASAGNVQFEQPRDVGVDTSGNVYVADNGNGRIIELSPTGTYLNKWKTEVGGGGAPIGITVSTTTADLPNLPAGQRVYVADGTMSQITVWNTDGTPVTPTAAATITDTTGACALNRMRDAAADAAGNVYVANYEDNNILEFTWNGSAWTCANSFGTKGTASTTGVCSGNGNGAFKNPYGVAIGTDPFLNSGAGGEAIYVADSNDDCIQEFTPDGTWVANIGGPGSDAQAGTFTQLRRVAVDPAGNVWGADLWGNRLEEFTPTALGVYGYDQTLPNPIVGPGNTSTSVFNQVRGIGFDAAGDTIAMDTVNQRVAVFSPTGTLINFCGQRGFTDTGDFNWPRGVAVDPNTGNYWIADTKQSDIQILAPISSPAMSGCNAVGYVTQTLGTGLGDVDYPDSITIAGGYAWVADTRNNRVDSWNVATEAPVSIFGTVGSGPNQFNNPTSVTVDPTTGDLFVADSGNNRVVELSVSNGSVTSTVATYTNDITDPYGAALNGAGLLAVANRNSDEVVILNESDSSVFATITGSDVTGGGPTTLSDPENLVFGPNGDLYIADTYNDRILVYTISQ
jgi:Mala s 1-like protein/NHL repeat-containing protein